ncbi:MAG: putative DNA binding domain-containing protein, partial [Planctomycetes bacterium]|nr:putative DNA binding domain-containing protein [Planctomycetota bacterium]
MPRESHHLEYKVSWRDEYIKWLCGFANAEGGTLEIGRDDSGIVVGLSNAAKLLEDIPNKVRDILGIMVDAKLQYEDNKPYLQIVVAPYPSPISYKGQYHYRSGSTKQELKGPALEQFLLKKRGRTWDAVPLPELKEQDLDPYALKLFRDLAAENGRMEAKDLSGSDSLLLDRLNLRDGSYLKRAAAILFSSDPERYITGASVKIGYFRSGADVAYHDVINGDLLGVVRKILDTLHLKYLKASITYRDIQRIETYPVPRAALREAILNALVHRDYAVGTPLQIRVYDDRLVIWNPATLPDGWTANSLQCEHASRPFNPLLAAIAFRAGEIEAWGRGIQRIQESCREAGTPEPAITYQHGELQLVFTYAPSYLASLQIPVKTTIKTTIKTPIENYLAMKKPEAILLRLSL